MTNQMARICNVSSLGPAWSSGVDESDFDFDWRIKAWGFAESLYGYPPPRPDVTLLVPSGKAERGKEIAALMANTYYEEGLVIEAWEMPHDLAFIAVDHTKKHDPDYVLEKILGDSKKFEADLRQATIDERADELRYGDDGLI